MAPDTTKKHQNFVAEPMCRKEVTQLPGVGQVLGQRLAEQGFPMAETMYGQFLAMRRDQCCSGDWLKQSCDANTKQQKDCYSSLTEWHDNW